MIDEFLAAPLARWDGFRLALDSRRLERHLVHLLANVDAVDDLTLHGADDAVGVEAVIAWGGMRVPVALELAEIRLRHRHLGFRIRRLRALGGLPIPRAAVEFLLGSLESAIVTVFKGQGIIVIDLRRWLPDELSAEVIAVQTTSQSIHVWFGSGSLHDLPNRGPRRLPAETQAL